MHLLGPKTKFGYFWKVGGGGRNGVSHLLRNTHCMNYEAIHNKVALRSLSENMSNSLTIANSATTTAVAAPISQLRRRWLLILCILQLIFRPKKTFMQKFKFARILRLFEILLKWNNRTVGRKYLLFLLILSSFLILSVFHLFDLNETCCTLHHRTVF